MRDVKFEKLPRDFSHSEKECKEKFRTKRLRGYGKVNKETQHEVDILLLLARWEKEIEAGVGHELDKVLEEADR